MPATTNSDRSTPVKNLVQSIRSDDLPKIAAMLRQVSIFKDRVEVFQVDVILDANVVIHDLLWLARKRKNPTARTELMELMECSVVRAHAPHYLIREMRVNLPELAEQHRLDLGKLQSLWKEYRKTITFVAVGGPDKRPGVIDPKDAPYIRLQKKLSFPIASADPHIPAMGGRVVRIQIFSSLRAYSRSAAIEYQFKMTGVGSAMMMSLLFEAGVALAQQASKIPPPVIWGGLIVAGLLLAHPISRKRIFEISAGLFDGGAMALEAAAGVILPMLDEHYSAQERARLNLADAQTALSEAQFSNCSTRNVPSTVTMPTSSSAG